MKPDFPSLADEMAEPRPDMNIKVAAFTVSERSINTTGDTGSEYKWHKGSNPLLLLAAWTIYSYADM